MSPIITGAITQLATMSPILLAYLTGAVLALVNWQRYPSAARFTLFGSLVLLAISVVQAFVFQYLLFERVRLGWTATNAGVMLSVLGGVTSILHAGGLGLLLAAIFVGRKTSSPGFVASLPRA